MQKINHATLYYYSLVLLALGLVVSEPVMSIAQFLLAGNWMWEGNFKNKFRILKERKSILLLLSIFLLHILWLINTHDDFNYALHDLRIKLPLLVLPLIIGTSPSLTNRHLKILMQLFIATVITSSFISTSVLMGITPIVISDIRDISLFISHIRFALLIDVSIFCLLFFLFNPRILLTSTEKIIYGLAIFWLILFLVFMQSVTGLVILFITGFILLIYLVSKMRSLFVRYAIFTVVLFIPVIAVGYVYYVIKDFYHIRPIDLQSLEKTTAAGNYYYHQPDIKEFENGEYLYLYVCEKELAEEWNKKSTYKYDGKDKKDKR